MIPRLHKRGTSFKGACSYILHDAGRKTSDRVLWTDTCNVFSVPEDAWFEMFATARDQAELKRQAGKDARGRKNDKPVLHYTLSWAESDNPSPEHMRETAMASLKAMKLDGHQAVMAAHKDKAHLHVHIVVNTIHPDTGMTAPLKYTKEQLSRWAEAYEKEHGLHCGQRVINNAERDRAREMSQAAALLSVGNSLEAPKKEQAPPFVPVKHRGSHRRRWYERQDVVDRMKRIRAEMEIHHKAERGATWERQKRERKELEQDCKAACDRARDHIEQQFRSQWRELYREQKKESREVERKATHPFERAVFVFRNRERLGNGKPLTLRQMLPLIRDQGKLLARMDANHEKERRSLAQAEKAAKAMVTEPILVNHEARLERLRGQQAQERKAGREAQYVQSRSISFAQAKASLRAQPYVHDIPRSVFKREQDLPAPAASSPSRAEEIRRHMEEWRKRNHGKDFGREM